MNKYFKLAALFVAAAISVAVVSCQKDKETEEPVASQSQNSEAKELLNRIYTFQELRDDINSGAKSGESMTLEELRDNIDLTFNFEHSQHATPFANATLDTFYVRMPQTDANGNVSAADAIATYNAFETSLENLLANVEDETNLAKNFSIKFPEMGAKNEDAIQVIFTRGELGTSPIHSGPFVEGDDYYWGKLLGYCEPRPGARNTDATVALTRLFQADSESANYLLYDIEYVGYTPYFKEYYTPGYIYFCDSTLTCGHNWLFLDFGDEIEPCIEYGEMNCYANNIKKHVVSSDGCLHWGLTSGSPYYECELSGMEFIPYYGESGTAPWIRFHTIIITYAKKACSL